MIQFRLFAKIVYGFSIPILSIVIWFSACGNPFDQYRLVVDGLQTAGYITEVKPESEVVEYNDGRSSAVAHFYNYKFYFALKNKLIIVGEGKEGGYIPDYLVNVDTEPYKVQVKYLADKPEINKIKGMQDDHTSLFEWFKSTFLIGFVFFLVGVYLGYLIIKSAIKKYKNEIAVAIENSNS